MSIDRLSGKDLIQFIQSYLDQPTTQKLDLKLTTYPNKLDDSHIHIIRCMRFERLIDLLEDRTVVGFLTTQHNILEVFLNSILLQDRAVLLERKGQEGFIIDLQVDGTVSYELKVKRNVDYRDISPFIEQYFDTMREQQNAKHIWWLAFFAQRVDSKAKKGEVCPYYIVVIELTTQHESMDPKNLKKITRHVQKQMDTIMQTVIEEDELEEEPEEAALLPVKNILLYEKVREEKHHLQDIVQEKNQMIIEKDQALQEKDQALQEKDQALQEKDKTIEMLQKQLHLGKKSK
jgi:hypothetical protein